MSVRDEWTTPPSVLAALVRLWPDGADLDPCSSQHSRVPARRRIMPPGDGLEACWEGRVFLNPPYSAPEPWIARLCTACRSDAAEGVALTLCDPSTRWFQHLWTGDAICFPSRRLQFVPPPWVDSSSNNRPNAITYWGPDVDRFAWAFRALGKVVRL